MAYPSPEVSVLRCVCLCIGERLNKSSEDRFEEGGECGWFRSECGKFLEAGKQCFPVELLSKESDRRYTA